MLILFMFLRSEQMSNRLKAELQEDEDEDEDDELSNEGDNCICGAYKWVNGKWIHVADCCC